MKEIDFEIFDDQVDRFLRRQMTNEEEQEFKSLLDNSTELKERARIIALTIKEMKSIQSKKDKHTIQSIQAMNESQYRRTAELPAKVYNLWPKVFKLAIAACFIGVISTIGLRLHTSSLYHDLATEELYLAYESDVSDDMKIRGALDKATFDNLILLFNNARKGEDLSQTIKQLEGLYAQSLKEDSELYDFRDDISWNLAFAYINDGNGDDAIPILEAMLERNKEWPSIATPIKEILDKLRKIN